MHSTNALGSDFDTFPPMRTSLRWLNDLLDRPIELDEAVDRLTHAGFPVEHWESTPDGDTVMEVELTSNRGDCLSHLGLAREIAAATGRTARDPSAAAAGWNAAQSRGASASTCARITNDDLAGCPLYTAHVIRGVKVGPSPEWMQSRLRAIGQNPRNNIVDCTNYVLFELGQPTHVFDLQKLTGSEIRVRRAKEGESFLPIGEGAKEITLRSSDLVIADGSRPVAIAGVKGGAVTAVTEQTTDILIEVASFDPRTVRAASRALGLASDSSFRFERTVDAGQVRPSAARLVQLILQLAGGTLCEGSLDAGTPAAAPRIVSLRVARCGQILGDAISAADIIRFLTPLGFDPQHDGGTIRCTIPPQRVDLEREVDLIEEVARLRGLDVIVMKDSIVVRAHPPQAKVAAIRAAKDLLAGLGFIETVTHTLISDRCAQPFVAQGTSPLRVDDDRAQEPVLRPSLLPSLLAVLQTNIDRAMDRPRLFEVARVFDLPAKEHRERLALSLIVADADGQQAFRSLRGAIERLFSTLFHAAPTFCPTSAFNGLDPCAEVRLAGQCVGSIGLFHRRTLKSLGAEGPIAAAELFISDAITTFPPEMRVIALAQFPPADRDLSVIVEESTSWDSVRTTVESFALTDLESVEFVSTFRGKQIGAGRKSLTLRMRFRAADRTLRREDVDDQVARCVTALGTTLRAEVRT
ncbi:MAG: phenylalanine--tRNA ligase subunit beta [Planctomycetota bacterium]|nr:phenylalanine--tRNA ligase subunit beta [Planctomycetota bacterium]